MGPPFEFLTRINRQRTIEITKSELTRCQWQISIQCQITLSNPQKKINTNGGLDFSIVDRWNVMVRALVGNFQFGWCN
jgi:hypothetical protein